MDIARQIMPPGWMTDYKTARIMRLLGGYEHPPMAKFVGGCVRNALLGKPVTDIDIATIHQPLQVIERLSHEGIRYVPTGLEHGTVTAIIDDTAFEITTLRKDVDTDGRHAVIAFTEKWSEDAQRRDFTINTLLATPDGSIYDPTGQGLSDLDHGRVVFVGDPAQRIAEDYLRILRFFRFFGYYGTPPADAAALDACKAQAQTLPRLSRERVTQEFLKILAAPDAATILGLMSAHGVMADLIERGDLSILARLCELQTRHDAIDVTARLFVIQTPASDSLDRWLILSNAQKRFLDDIGRSGDIVARTSKKALREAVYRHGNAAALQAYLIRLASMSKLPDIELLDIARYWQAPAFPVTGHDLLAAGHVAGPDLGRALETLERKWIASDFKKVPDV